MSYLKKYRQAHPGQMGDLTYVGEFEANYSTLIKCFGHPNGIPGDRKVDVIWNIEFEDGNFASIHNWKNGKNYLGAEGTSVENIKEWMVNGRDRIVVDYIREAIENSPF